jgi:AraC-like DNA-binding protein
MLNIMDGASRDVLDAIAPQAGASGRDRARFLRPAALPGAEFLDAYFVRHRYAAHVHDVWTVAAVERGAAAFDLAGTRHVAPAGSTFLIPPGAVHTGEPATPGGYRYRVLYLDPALVSERATRGDPAAPVVLPRARELLGPLIRLHRAAEFPGIALEQGELLRSVTDVLAGLLPVKAASGHGKEPAAVQRAIEYIHAHLFENFSLDELARAAALSPYHLIRIFRKCVGVPPAGYRRALRVLAAQRLLRVGEVPADVAAACGFYDQAHLNRHFKSLTGVTPAQYAHAGG